MKRILTTSIICTALALWSLGHDTAVRAAQLSLSDVPLFLGFTVEPNILLVVDDSGSMDWEVVTKDASNDGRFTGTQPDGTSPVSSGLVKHRDGDDNGIPNCGFGILGQTFYGYLYGVEFADNTYTDDGNDCNTADEQEWRFRNSDFNPLYFNLNRTYTPWAGVDAAGNPFQNMPITAAKANPYDPASRTIDLTRHNANWTGNFNDRTTSDRDGDGVADGFRYYTWTDLNGNGLFDNGEETAHLIKDADAATQQNFANWFSYYRKREHVAKGAFGQVVANITSARVGLVTLHNNNSVNTAISSMNADPTIGNKRTLLNKIYSINSANSTPLRQIFNQAGRYFECVSNSLFSSCPVLSAAQGGACQQNFIILMTDGFYNDSAPGVGNTDGPGNGNSAWDGKAYADNFSDTLADVAMRYYERDLHSSLSNNIPITPGVDEATHQHVVTYGVSFGQTGDLTSDPLNITLPFAWPSPFASDKGKIDDLRHAAFNGRGEFLDASDPNNLLNTLNAVIKSIAQRTSSAASVALNSGSHSANSRVYQARFNSGEWSGQLLSFPVDTDGNIATPEWDASTALGSQNYDTGRTILTYNPTTTVGVPFRWNQINTTQQTQLHINPSGTNDGQGQARLDYLRGSTAHEGTGNRYRVRLKRLGDLINSDPFFVGAPSFPNSLGTGYASFRSTYSSRTPMVYAGGNDGMLHGFSASNGAEKLAYVPNKVFAKLSKLTNPAYTHLYYVDGSPTVGDAFGSFGTRCPTGSPCWRSVLVSGLRKGGQGVFALDVTDPATFSEGNAAKLVLWEFTDANDADLGYSFSQPSIVKMANGQWAAVFGNGYNNSEADGLASTTGRAALYILFLDKGLDGVWTPGTDFIKLSTGTGSTGTPNGLATPAAVDLDGDDTTDLIYAGDLLGNLWRFDVRDASPSNWAAPALVFTAKNASNNSQPITSRPEVGTHPEGPGVLVYFGTGKYLESSDNTAGVPTQTFYAIWDKLETPPTAITRSNLVQQTVLSEANGQRITTDNAADWVTHRGWYLDLPTAEERQVSDAILRNNRIIFTTLIPNTQICSFGGTSWLMELNAQTGSRLETSPFDLNDDNEFTDADKVTATINGEQKQVAVSGLLSTQGILPSPTVLSSGTTEMKYNSGSAGGIFVTTEDPGPSARGRQAWRQFQ